MTASREDIIDALLTRLEGAFSFATVSRRNRAAESFTPAETPALILVEHGELHRNPSMHQPTIRKLFVKAIIYSDVGLDENAIPATPVNNALDAFEAALKPDNAMTGECTLAGLVQSVMIDGNVIKAPGDITGKSVAIVPLAIVWP